MEGIIHHYRQSRSRQYNNHMIVGLKGVSSRDKAQEHVGKKVTFITETGKQLNGEVASAHGNSGAVRVIFKVGVPGQALGKKVTVA